MDWSKKQRIMEYIRADDVDHFKELSADYDVNTLDLYPCNDTALQYACRFGSKQVAIYLLQHGADVNYGSSNALSPLIHCIRNDDCELVELMCLSGADVNKKSPDGRSTLAWCLFCPTTIEVAELNVKQLCMHGLKLGINSEQELNDALFLLEDSESLRVLLQAYGFLPRSPQHDDSLLYTCVHRICHMLTISSDRNLLYSVQELPFPHQVKSLLLLGCL